MKPSELTAYVVRGELEHLINNYPERMGSIMVDEDSYDDTTCVYYTDQTNNPISFPAYVEDNIDEIVGEIALKTPVCIIGQWIESFHPEFKDDEVIRELLFRNNTMRHSEVPFDPDVKLLLTRAQDQQDAGKHWGAIDLNRSSDW